MADEQPEARRRQARGWHRPEAVRLYTPDDTAGHDYLATVGLPGEYPFTAWLYPVATPFSGGGELNRAGRYSGYGTSEDCRDYYLAAARSGLRIGGPNVASDLPSQLGWDSDAAEAAGEVGRVGVAIDSLRDFETIYEAFGEPSALGRISKNWTINGPAAIYVAFYYALARKHAVDLGLAALYAPERHPQGVRRSRAVHLPRQAFDAAGGQHHVVHGRADAAVKLDQHLR